MNLRKRCAVALFFHICVTQAFAQTKAAAIPENKLPLRDGWALQTSAKVEAKGEVISTEKFAPHRTGTAA